MWRSSLRLPRHAAARSGQPCPPGITAIRLTIAETARIERLARQHAAGLITRTRLAFCLRWSRWRRRHQARARWHHYSTRLQAAAATRPQRPEGGDLNVTPTRTNHATSHDIAAPGRENATVLQDKPQENSKQQISHAPEPVNITKRRWCPSASSVSGSRLSHAR